MLMSAQTRSPANLPRTVAVATTPVADRRAGPTNLMGIVLVATTLVVGGATALPTPAAQAITPNMLLEARPLVG